MERLTHALEYADRLRLTVKRPVPSGVYVFSCRNFYKVGITGDPHKRLQQAQVSCPYEVKLVTFRRITNARDVERWLHCELADYHVRGEWFKLPKRKLLAVLNGIASADGQQPLTGLLG
jgi:hypothetical protein